MTGTTDERAREVRTENAEACPVVHAIDQVGTPWRLNVLYALQEGEMRFNELKRATEARSKTLSEALDALVANDVVDRRMEEAAPVAVYYALTPKGEALSDVLADLGEWAKTWVDDVSEGRERVERAGRP